MITFFRHIKHAAPGTHLLQQFVLLQQKQIVLKLFQIPFYIHIVDMRKNLRYETVVLLMPVAVPDASVPIHSVFKRQLSVPVRRQFPAEIPEP